MKEKSKFMQGDFSLNLFLYFFLTTFVNIIKHHSFTMVNSEQFSERLQKILDYYDLSAANFAEAIDVGRSSISHIVSGRNKPSLDFVMKVVQSFPEVELYWLLNGKGSFPSSKEESKKERIPNPPVIKTADEEVLNPSVAKEVFQDKKSSAKIRKIVIFYEDGSFEAFEN